MNIFTNRIRKNNQEEPQNTNRGPHFLSIGNQLMKYFDKSVTNEYSQKMLIHIIVPISFAIRNCLSFITLVLWH